MLRLYDNDKVKKLIEDLNDVSKSKYLILKEVDIVIMKAIKKRCNELKAAPNFECIVRTHLGNCESLSGNYSGCYSLTLTANVRLIIAPNSVDQSVENLLNCKEYYLKGVVDYHDKRTKPNWIIP